MLKRMIFQRVVLAGLMVVQTCLPSSAEPLKIGMVGTLTGAAAEPGRDETQCAKFAAEEVNKAGGVLGRPIELVPKATPRSTEWCEIVQRHPLANDGLASIASLCIQPRLSDSSAY